MDKYDVMGKLGDGTYGIVLRAKLKRTGEVVAIKRMKQRFRTFDECTRLAEVIVLRKLHSCPHVVRLREIFREASGELSLVFDFMDCDLLAVIRKHKQIGIPSARIRNMSFQVIQGLAFIHRIGYFHRDMKPENILVRRDPNGGAESVKLADMGLAKEIRGRPPYTDYVSTRWYRAPEILLQDRAYNSPVDMWAMGCIMVELFTGRPLFPGTNEQDQLFKIVSVLGAPTMSTWPEGVELARKLGRRFPAMSPTPLSQLYPTIPGPALDLIARMLAMNPRQRITAQQALAHPYLQGLADATSGAESTPRPQVMARPGVAATAPSPHTKGDPVSWQDVVGSGQKPPSAGAGAAAGAGVPASQRTTAAGSATSGRSVGAPAGSTVDVLKYSSPYGRGTGAPAASGNRAAGRPPVGHAAAGAALPQSDTTPQQQTEHPTPKPVGGATGSGRYTFSHQAGGSTGAKPSWAMGPGSSHASPAGPSVSTPSAPQPAPSASLPQVPKKVEPVVALRDSFDGLFRAAGIDVDAVLARADAPSSTAALPKRGSPPASGAPRSPVTVGGTLAMPTRRSPTQIDSTPPPADRSPGAAHQQGAGSASRLVMHGRRQASASPDNENRAPPVGSMGGGAMLGESPLTKLLARSRYRANGGLSASPDAAGTSSGAAGSGVAAEGGSGGRQTFKSPSFARRPSPLSVSVLQQKAGGSSSNAVGVDSALQAHRRLFDGEPAPGGAASARPVMGVPGHHHHQAPANAHHQPLRATHHTHLPSAGGGGGDHPGF